MSLCQDKLCIGLTGGIGCGKSSVARLFAALGASIIDTDAISHQLTQEGGAAITAISSVFGPDYITDKGALDRTRMRQLVFSDATARLKLENILHPLILEQSIAQIQTASCPPYTILMAPLLLECPAFLNLVQRVLVIDCTEQNQISRVRQRSGLDEIQIREIIAGQISSVERVTMADDIIRNDATPDDLVDQVFALHQRYLSLGAKTPFDGN
ncbi:MAG: dephospho-CoA kinase [Gallionella sp.]|jgi:dephospho-CoA kinase